MKQCLLLLISMIYETMFAVVNFYDSPIFLEGYGGGEGLERKTFLRNMMIVN